MAREKQALEGDFLEAPGVEAVGGFGQDQRLDCKCLKFGKHFPAHSFPDSNQQAFQGLELTTVGCVIPEVGSRPEQLGEQPGDRTQADILTAYQPRRFPPCW